MPPSLSPMGVAMVATALFVRASMRSTRRSVQLGDQTLSKPVAIPEHGARPVWTVATSAADDGSSRATVLFALFEIQTASALIPTQSGLPGIDCFAEIGSSAIGRCTACRFVIIGS